MKNSILFNILKTNLVKKTSITHPSSNFEARVSKLKPLEITDDYLNTYPIKACQEIKELLLKNYFNKISLNIKLIFKSFKIIFVEERHFFTFYLDLKNVDLKILEDIDIIRFRNKINIECISKNEEIIKKIKKLFFQVPKFNSYILGNVGYVNFNYQKSLKVSYRKDAKDFLDSDDDVSIEDCRIIEVEDKVPEVLEV